MTVDDLIAIIVIGLCVYRISRLVVLDTIWEEWRDRLIGWLDPSRIDGRKKPKNLVMSKLAELIGCPFCNGFWIAVIFVACWWNDWLPRYVYWVLGSASVALIVFNYIDGEEDH